MTDQERDRTPEENGEIVGADDARADAARAGADTDLDGATRDSDPVPVGRADLEEDIRRTREDTGD
jgi:hypothetical protein